MSQESMNTCWVKNKKRIRLRLISDLCKICFLDWYFFITELCVILILLLSHHSPMTFSYFTSVKQICLVLVINFWIIAYTLNWQRLESEQSHI